MVSCPEANTYGSILTGAAVTNTTGRRSVVQPATAGASQWQRERLPGSASRVLVRPIGAGTDGQHVTVRRIKHPVLEPFGENWEEAQGELPIEGYGSFEGRGLHVDSADGHSIQASNCCLQVWPCIF